MRDMISICLQRIFIENVAQFWEVMIPSIIFSSPEFQFAKYQYSILTGAQITLGQHSGYALVKSLSLREHPACTSPRRTSQLRRDYLC